MQGIRHIIESYKKTLQPSIYFLSAKMEGNAIIGIEKTVLEYPSQEDRDRHGAIIVYYPFGLPISDVDSLTTSVADTPWQYQKKLIEFLQKKLASVHAETPDFEQN
jgi:hypothetical protein